MLNQLCPRQFPRLVALPVLGQVADDYDTWLCQQEYGRSARAAHARALVRIDGDLRRRGHRQWQSVRPADLDACLTRYRARDPYPGAAVRGLLRFAQERSLLPARPPAVTRVVAMLATSYGVALYDLRGLVPATIHQHVTTVAQFLSSLDYEIRPERLAALTASDVEAFVRQVSHRLSRGTLQHRVAQLRGFLRFLASAGRVRPGLDGQIDTPRVYRQEHLPRSLPWPTVQKLLRAVDRRTPHGLRDYAMLFLVATYGLRACEIVALTLDAIDWRGRRLQVHQRKGGIPLVLPLTDAAGTVLLQYLRRRPPLVPRIANSSCATARRPGSSSPPPSARCFRNGSATAACRLPSAGPTVSATRMLWPCCGAGSGSKPSATCSAIAPRRAPAPICGSPRTTSAPSPCRCPGPPPHEVGDEYLHVRLRPQGRHRAVPRAEARLGPPVRARAARARDARGLRAYPPGVPRRAHPDRLHRLGADAAPPDAHGPAQPPPHRPQSLSLSPPHRSRLFRPRSRPRSDPAPAGPRTSSRPARSPAWCRPPPRWPRHPSVPSGHTSSVSRWSSSTPWGSAAASSSD
jgi:integrase/recombinase XerD